jgi:hypothetical protein
MLWRKRSKLYEQARLVPHPSSKGGPLADLTVEFRREDQALVVEFTTHEDSDGVRWPALAEPRRRDKLWQTTCFEVFVEADDGYWEYNLSPSSEWAVYRFESYRKGMKEAEEFAASSGTRFENYWSLLRAQLRLPPAARRLGFSAVIEDTDGAISYWALTHPSDKPDFHHPDSFVLEIP